MNRDVFDNELDELDTRGAINDTILFTIKNQILDR